jgi:hypothetical protein
MPLPTIEIETCSDGAPCQATAWGGGCYRLCALDQMAANGPQLAAVVDRARAGSSVHVAALQRAGLDF